MAVTSTVAAPPHPQLSHNNETDDDNVCWICLDGADRSDGRPGNVGRECGEASLIRPCLCPSYVHRECLATWQLHSFGKRESQNCRFCNHRLPELWKHDPSEKPDARAQPVMAVRYNGPNGTQEFKLRVQPGPEGLALFKAHLREVLGIDIGPEFDVTFECMMPSTGKVLTLSGLGAYGAATTCAALTAAHKVPKAPTGLHPAAERQQQDTMDAVEQEEHHGSGASGSTTRSDPLPRLHSSRDGHQTPGARRMCQSGYRPVPLAALPQSSAMPTAGDGSRPCPPAQHSQRSWSEQRARPTGHCSQEGGEEVLDGASSDDELLPRRPVALLLPHDAHGTATAGPALELSGVAGHLPRAGPQEGRVGAQEAIDVSGGGAAEGLLQPGAAGAAAAAAPAPALRGAGAVHACEQLLGEQLGADAQPLHQLSAGVMGAAAAQSASVAAAAAACGEVGATRAQQAPLSKRAAPGGSCTPFTAGVMRAARSMLRTLGRAKGKP